jgi:HSP20 family protein
MARPRDIDQLQREIQELFSDLWQVPRFAGTRPGFRPQADCYRTEDPPEIHVVVELPGVDPERVEVVTVGRTLTISGVRERPRLPPARVQQMELEYGQFQRQLQLGDDVDAGNATATYDRGLLRIVLPLAPAPPPQERRPIAVERRA